LALFVFPSFKFLAILKRSQKEQTTILTSSNRRKWYGEPAQMFFSRYDSATVISLQSQLHLRTVGTCAGRDCAEAGEAAGKLQFGKDLSD